MYEIYAYPFSNPDVELLVYQPGNKQAIVLAPKLTREVSKSGSLVFTMPRDHPQYEKLQKMSTVVTVKQDGTEIWRGRILNHEADWYNRRVIYCEGALAYFNDSCITPFNYEGTLGQFLQYLVDAHNAQVQDAMKRFALGTVTAALGELTVKFGDADKYGAGEDYGSIWEIIDKMVLKVFGGYVYCTFDPDTGYNLLNYCDQAYEASRQVDQDIRYGVNLLDLTEKTDTNDLFTRIYPVGNKHTVAATKWYYKLAWWKDHSHDSDEDHEERYGIMDTDEKTVKKYLPASGWSYDLKEGWIQNDAAMAKFGIIAKIREQDTDSDNDTFAAAVQDLQQNYAMVTSYTVSAVDLVDAGYDLDRLTFASFAHILSAPHGVDAIMLCTKLVEPFEQPDKKEYTFGMTRRTLTDRQAANMGRTNQLEEQAITSSNSAEKLLKNLTDYKKTNDAAVSDAAKTATNFLAFSDEDGLTVGHKSLPDKKVRISNDGVKVLSGTSMVNITADSISITDGAGSCTISSGEIVFHGIQNKQTLWENDEKTFAAQTVQPKDHILENYSALLILFRSQKNGTWFSGGGNAGLVSLIVPVNGVEMSMVYPWNTVHKRSVTVYSDRIEFGTGYERTSTYTTGIAGIATFIGLESPTSDGWNQNDGMCVPYKIYGFM